MLCNEPSKHLTVILIFFAATSPVLTLYSGVIIAPLYVLTGVLLLWVKRSELETASLWNKKMAFVAAVVIWAFFSCFHPEVKFHAVWSKILSTTFLVVLTILAIEATYSVDPTTKKQVSSVVRGSVMVAALLLSIDALLDFPTPTFLFQLGIGDGDPSLLSRGAVLMALFIWPAMFGASKRATVALISIVTFAVWASGKEAVFIALVLGLSAFAVCLLFPQQSVRLFRAVVCAAVLLVPIAGKNLPSDASIISMEAPHPVGHRLYIWRFVSEKVLEKPILGYGFGASRFVADDALPLRVERLDKNGQTYVREYWPLPLHPHSAFLQVWLELGLPGAVLLCVLLFWIFRRIEKNAIDRQDLAANVAAIITITTIANLSFGIWQSWWISAICATAVMLSVVKRPRVKTCAE